MPLKPWKKLSEMIVFKNPYWTYKRNSFELPSGQPGEYHYVHTIGSSMVIPIVGDGTILMVNQYRYLLGKESMEFPCGSVKEGSTYEETAGMELREETGHEAKSQLMVGEFNPYNGVTDEMCNVYVARDLQYVGGTPDETEEFAILRVTPGEIETRIRSGVIWDGMSIAAWSIAKSKSGM